MEDGDVVHAADEARAEPAAPGPSRSAASRPARSTAPGRAALVSPWTSAELEVALRAEGWSVDVVAPRARQSLLAGGRRAWGVLLFDARDGRSATSAIEEVTRLRGEGLGAP